MNPNAAVEAARPDVGPMPADDRRHVRERLFDVASGPPSPSSSTKVVSVDRSVTRRLVALAFLGVAGAGALALNAARTSDGEGVAGSETLLAEPTVVTEVIALPVPPTLAPTTTAAPAAGSPDAPLLMPVGRIRLDELRHDSRPRGQSAVWLLAPDGSTIGLLETDGLAPVPPTTTLPDAEPDPEAPIVVPWERVGNIRARRVISDDPDVRRYEVDVSCGTFEVADGDRFEQNRQEIRDLLSSITIVDGVIDIALPTGWEVISNGTYTGRFEIGLPIDENGGASPFHLVQYPSSEIAFGAYGGTQFRPVQFLGSQAWVGQHLDDPSDLTIVGSFGDTAFTIDVSGLTLPQIEAVMLRLEAGSIDDWIERFGALDEPEGPDFRTCLDQPEFTISR